VHSPRLWFAVGAIVIGCSLVATQNADGATLPCAAHVVNPHPANYTLAHVVVRMAPRARVVATGRRGSAQFVQMAIADSKGIAQIYFKISYVIKRVATTVTIVVKKGSATGSCRTSFTAV